MNFALIVSSLGEVVAQADVSTILYQRTLISLVSKTLLRSDEIPIDEDAEDLLVYVEEQMSPSMILGWKINMKRTWSLNPLM